MWVLSSVSCAQSSEPCLQGDFARTASISGSSGKGTTLIGIAAEQASFRRERHRSEKKADTGQPDREPRSFSWVWQRPKPIDFVHTPCVSAIFSGVLRVCKRFY